MELKNKLRFTYLCIGFNFFLGGVEYAVILPTCWLYMQERFNAQSYFFGIVMSAFQFSGLFAGPIMGRWSDITHQTKWVLLVANLFEVAGNIMYFLGISKWFVLASRLVAGVGTGAGPAIIADLSRSSDPTQRTSVLSKFLAVRQFGLVLGPAFNLFLREFDFSVGPYVVDKFTSPGLFMALLWLLLELLVLLLYWELPVLARERKMQEEAAAEPFINGDSPSTPGFREFEASRSHVRHDTPVVTSQQRGGLTDSTRMLVEAEEYMAGASSSTEACVSHYSDIPQQRHLAVAPPQQVPESPAASRGWRYYVNEFVRDEMVALLYQLFIAYFAQMGLETMFTPLSQKYLGFGELENSIFYSAAGVQILLVFALMQPLSRRYRDRTLIIAGNLLLIAALIWMLIILPVLDPADHQKNLAFLLSGVALDVAALPMMLVCTVSLYSKITHEETQGFAQGIRRTVASLGLIMGPLWAGALVRDQLRLLLAVCVAGTALALLLLLCSFGRLHHSNRNDGTSQVAANSEQNGESHCSSRAALPTERTPLMS